jgi:hypothetical protein
LGTIGLGAAVLATHAGVGFGGFFGGIVEASRDGWKGAQVVVVRRYTPSPITQGR